MQFQNHQSYNPSPSFIPRNPSTGGTRQVFNVGFHSSVFLHTSLPAFCVLCDEPLSWGFFLLHVFSILMKIKWEAWWKNKLTCDLQVMVQLTLETDM